MLVRLRKTLPNKEVSPMDDLDLWLARAVTGVGIAVAISKEARSWYVSIKEQEKKRQPKPRKWKR